MDIAQEGKLGFGNLYHYNGNDNYKFVELKPILEKYQTSIYGIWSDGKEIFLAATYVEPLTRNHKIIIITGR